MRFLQRKVTHRNSGQKAKGTEQRPQAANLEQKAPFPTTPPLPSPPPRKRGERSRREALKRESPFAKALSAFRISLNTPRPRQEVSEKSHLPKNSKRHEIRNAPHFLPNRERKEEKPSKARVLLYPGSQEKPGRAEYTNQEKGSRRDHPRRKKGQKRKLKTAGVASGVGGQKRGNHGPKFGSTTTPERAPPATISFPETRDAHAEASPTFSGRDSERRAGRSRVTASDQRTTATARGGRECVVALAAGHRKRQDGENAWGLLLSLSP